MAIEVNEAIAEFLRVRLTDPRSRHTAKQNTFNGDGSTTVFTFTPTAGKTLQAISSVTVDGADKKKWEAFDIDLQNSKITFNSSNIPTVGTNNVVINGLEGTTSWIYIDKPRTDLSVISFPRMHVKIIDGPDKRAGLYTSSLFSTLHVQLTCWAKEGKGSSESVFTIGGRKYEGQRLVAYLLNQARLAFKSNENDLYPILHGYQTLAFRPDLAFEETYQSFVGVLEFQLMGTDVGE